MDETSKQEKPNLIHNYNPVKTHTTDFKMSILLKGDISVAQGPRRMSLTEKNRVCSNRAMGQGRHH